MYPSGSNNAYGAQSYATHQTYGQMTGASGTSLSSQRLSGIYGSSQQTETSAYRGNIPSGPGASTAGLQYGGQYGAYPTPATHQGLSGGSYSVKSPSRGQYGPSQGAFSGRDLMSESGRRMYSDHVGLGRSHQPELQSEHDDQISFFRQQQLIHAQKPPTSVDMRQSMVDSSFDGSIRATDYLAARGPPIRHKSQDYATRDSLVSSYGMRTDVDPGTQGSHQLPSLPLRAAMGRNLEDDAYARGSSGTSYGVTLPPGRDYSTGKVLGSTPSDVSYRGPPLTRKEERGPTHYSLERDEEFRRDRGRDRERERLLERRERERDREHVRAREIRRRDRTPPRSSKDRRASPKKRMASPKKWMASPKKRTASPKRRTASPKRRTTGSLPVKRSPPRLHRHSPQVKERRRGYICKITPYCLVEAERDLSSISRRYPRLSIAPEFSKLVLRWPRGDLDISFYKPVSFEHDIVELSGEADLKAAPSKSADKGVVSGPSKPVETVWNAKVILMSGISPDALSQLVSEKSSSDKVVHVNSILRFAVFREGRAFNAIGGSWVAEMDGGDPADDMSLIRTAIRCTKERVQVDLANCLRWNPFLEIHYDRVSKDGLCSYREVSLLFLPDLENCLPSLDVWCSQWISRREARVEREREALSKKEKKDKHTQKKDDAKGDPNAVESTKSSKVSDKVKNEKDGNKIKESELGSVDTKEKVVASESAEDMIKKEKVDPVKKEKDDPSIESMVDGDPKSEENVKKRAREDLKGSKSEENTNSATKVKKAKVTVKVKKVKAGKKQVPAGEVETSTPKLVKKVIKKSGKKTAEKNMGGKPGNVQAPKETQSEQITTKKKVKKVIKKEHENANAAGGTTVNAAEKQTAKKVVKKFKAKEDQLKETKKAGKIEKVARKDKEVKQGDSVDKNEDHKMEGLKEGDVKIEKLDSGAKETKEKLMANSGETTKGEDKLVEVKKDEGKSEPPQFPGLFLQTKRSKDSNVRSTTLSLDGLLDYNENDVEESTFELSLFAEVFYEMLQFKMGCRIVSFLEKVEQSYLKKRTQRKREREENSEKDEGKEGLAKKRPKVSSTSKVEDDSAKPKTSESDHSKLQEEVANVKSNQCENDEQQDKKVEAEESEEEDPEEEPLEEDEDENEVGSDGSQKEEQSEDEKMGDELQDSAPEKTSSQEKVEEKHGHVEEKQDALVKVESSKQSVVDKELLEAFRFFDREWVGYIKVDDMRTIIHNLGKFYSKRAVKELLRVAVQESNKDRDGRIYYMKLLKADL